MDLDGRGHYIGRRGNTRRGGHGNRSFRGLLGRHGLDCLGGQGGGLAAFFLLLLQGVQGVQEGTLQAVPLHGDSVEQGEALFQFQGGLADQVLAFAGAHEEPLSLDHLFEKDAFGGVLG